MENELLRIHEFAKTTLFSKITLTILVILCLVSVRASCQEAAGADSVKIDPSKKKSPAMPVIPLKQYDLTNLVHDLFHPNGKPDSTRRRSGINVVPNISSNPSIGQQIGIKAVVGRVLGADPNTYLSVAATSASITTKDIIYFYLYHNIFTNGNKRNLTGIIAAGKAVVPDYGLGIGSNSAGANQVLTNPGRRAYGLQGQLFTIREKSYKEIKDNLYLGVGLSFDVRRKFENLGPTGIITPYDIYSDQHGFSRTGYSSNGILLDLQYVTRDNQNRAYKGMYFDAGLKSNQTWIGSSRQANQFTYDFRKYVSLSKTNPEHIIAFWNWGSYLLGGNLAYLDLPGTQKDPSLRSGRGYTIGYFKGTQYNDTEVEYRFPITRNKFISGVTFFNLQTANDDAGTRIFEVFQPGGGAGLRALFNKVTRTNLCLDYAFGKFGQKGFFLGLNEAF
jgi:hypothetical protein